MLIELGSLGSCVSILILIALILFSSIIGIYIFWGLVDSLIKLKGSKK